MSDTGARTRTASVPFTCSWRLIPSRFLRGCWGIVLLVVAATGWADDQQQPWRSVLLVVIGCVLAALVLTPVYDTFFRRLVVTEDHVSLTTGRIAPTELNIALVDVSSVQVDRPWHLQLLGLSIVTISAQGQAATSVVLDGLTRADADRLHHLVSGRRDEASPTARPSMGERGGSRPVRTSSTSTGTPVLPGAPAAEADLVPPRSDEEIDRVLYSASRRDLVATMASQGILLTVTLGVLGWFGDVDDLLHADLVHRFPLWVAGLGVLLAVSVAMAASAAQLRSLSISSLVGGGYRVSYGSLGHVQHDVRRDDVLAVTLTTTPVDLLLGTVRLSLGTVVKVHEHQPRLQFPSMRPAEALHVVAALTGLTEVEAPRRRLRAVLPPLLSLLAGAAGATAAATYSVGVRAVVAALALGATAAFVHYVTCRVEVSADGSHLVVSRDGLVATTTYCSRSWVRGVLVRRISRGGPAHVCVVGWAQRRQTARLPVTASTSHRLGALLDHDRSAPWKVPAPVPVAAHVSAGVFS